MQQQNTKSQQELLHLIHTPVMKVPSNGRKMDCTEFELFYCFNVRLILIHLFIHSNDKNLCSKALLCGVRAFSKKDLESEVKRFKHTSNVPLQNSKTSTVPHTSHQTSLPVFGKLLLKCNMLVLSFTWHVVYMCLCMCVCVELLTENKPLSQTEVEEKTKWDVSQEVCELEDLLRDVLSDVLEVEMKAVYADLWLEVEFNFAILLYWTVINHYQQMWLLLMGCLMSIR